MLRRGPKAIFVTLNLARLRTAFVVYGAMNRRDLRTVTVRRRGMAAGEYGRMLVAECREALSTLLPFDEAEQAFLDQPLDHGEIGARILTSDLELQQRTQAHPSLKWMARKVRQHRGLG